MDFTWSPVRWHLGADGVGPHDDVLIVDSRVGLLVYHLTTQKPMSLHWQARTSLSSWLWVQWYEWYYINEWVDSHVIILVDL